MSVLAILLRRHRRESDERRQYLADLERLGQRLRGDANRLLTEIDAASAGFGRPDAALVARHAALERSVAEIDTQIVTAAGRLAAAEAQLRRTELSQARLAGQRRRGSRA